MTAEKWTHRVRPEAAAGDLEKLKAVAEELAQHAKRAPGAPGWYSRTSPRACSWARRSSAG